MKRLGRVLLIIAVLGGAACNLLTTTSAYADSWSWGSGRPIVKAIEASGESNGGWCRGLKVSAEVERRGDQTVCLTDQLPTSGLRWGYYYSGGYQVPVISLAHEAKFYVINGLSYDARVTHYSAWTDTLVIGYPIGALGKLRVYRHVLERLSRVKSPTGEVSFNFNGSSVDFGGNPDWWVGTAGLSNNGRFAAVELRDYGIALIDLSTDKTRLITDQYLLYDYGADPYAEYAVSNDGGLVVRAGMNVALQAFAVNDHCGVAMGTTAGSPRISLAGSGCPSISLPFEAFVPNGGNAFYAPSFSDSGGLLRFYVRDLRLGGRFVTLAAASYQSAEIAYLALGDSYTSGEGETNDAFYAEGTNTDYEKCHLSLRSYPFLYGLQLGLAYGVTKSVACSGATSDDIVAPIDAYWGQTKRLGSGGLNLSNADRLSRQQQALNNFTPGQAPQLSFVEKYSPQLITVGIGGNDSGLFGKLSACAMPSDCEWVSPKGKAQTYQEINALTPKLTAAYQKIKQASPNSDIYAVNYPEVIDLSGHCDAVTAGMFGASERRLIIESIRRINTVINDAANQAGIKVLDIEQSFYGHRLCEDSQQPAVSGLRRGDDFGPTGWLRLLGNETFHPSPYGHQLIADAIERQITHPSPTSEPCDKGCQDADSKDYWRLSEVLGDYPAAHAMDLITKTTLSSLDSRLVVRTPAYLLAPLSSVKVRLDSVMLISGQTDQVGLFTAEVPVPSDLSEGTHVLHVEGQSPTGNQADNYQTINYQPPHIDKPVPKGDKAAADHISKPSQAPSVAVVNSRAAAVTQTQQQAASYAIDSPPVWDWRLPIYSLDWYVLTSSPLNLTFKTNQHLKTVDTTASNQAVLAWRDQQPGRLTAWLFGPALWCRSERLAPWVRPGIMSPWLIFAFW